MRGGKSITSSWVWGTDAAPGVPVLGLSLESGCVTPVLTVCCRT